MKGKFGTLAKKELMTYINAPLAYLILVPFTLIASFLFFRSALMLGDANLRPFIELLPWFLVVIAPALAMRVFSDEQRKQTIELLFAHPVSEWTVVLAKFTGLLMFFVIFLLSTIALPITLIFFGKPDAGLMMSQYLGALAIGAAFLAIGMATSAYIASAVGAFLVGAAISFGLILLGLNFVVLMVPGLAGRVLAEMTILPHLTNISRGVLDLRDLIYFATITGVALAATVLKLAERKVAEKPAERVKLLVTMGLILAVGVASNVVMYDYPIRLDLTANQQFSLSQGSKTLLRELPDRVTVTLYTSPNLPGPMQATLKETSDRLKDFSRLSNRLIVKTVVVDPAGETAQEARQQGIREVQFNQIGSSIFAVQTGFLGLSLQYGDKQEVIDFIDDAGGLEYQLSRLILKLTRETQTKVGLFMNTSDFDYTQVNQFLSNQYEVVTLAEATTDKDLVDLNSVVVIDDGSESTSTAAAMIKSYFLNGGNGVVLANGVNIDQQSLAGTKSTSEFLTLLSDWGVSINQDLTYDLQLNEAIALGQGATRYILPYPFWIRALVNGDNVPWRSAVNSAVLGWPSSLTLGQKDGVTLKPLLATSTAANQLTEDFTIAPDQVKSLPPPSGQAYTLAALVEKGEQRLGVVGNTTLANDNFLENSRENGVFVANLIDWATADPILLAIPQKSGGRTVFTFTSPTQVQLVQYLNILVPPVIVMILGFWWLNRRKRLSLRVYHLDNEVKGKAKS